MQHAGRAASQDLPRHMYMGVSDLLCSFLVVSDQLCGRQPQTCSPREHFQASCFFKVESGEPLVIVTFSLTSDIQRADTRVCKPDSNDGVPYYIGRGVAETRRTPLDRGPSLDQNLHVVEVSHGDG